MNRTAMEADRLPDDAMQGLADTVTQAATRTEKALQKERMEITLRSKQQSPQPQAEPIGLFAQTQGTLFARP